MLKIVVLLLCCLLSRLYGQEPLVENLALHHGEIVLPGTLTFVPDGKKLPLIIFVHGSGNIDRDGNQAGLAINANYIKTLSDSLVRRGIAFYRYDKRTATKGNLDKLSANITLNDFVEDVQRAIDYFKEDTRFSEIVLIGHSQGSLVAMLAVDESISKYVSLAGSGEPIDRTIVDQLSKQQKEMGVVAQQYFDELRETDTIETVNPFLLGLFAPKNQKFLKHWMMLDPREEIAKVSVPTLILNGDADLQIGVGNAENLHKALPGSTLKIIPRMNHVLKEVHSETENVAAYTDEKFPLSTILVDVITEFIKS